MTSASPAATITLACSPFRHYHGKSDWRIPFVRAATAAAAVLITSEVISDTSADNSARRAIAEHRYRERVSSSPSLSQRVTLILYSTKYQTLEFFKRVLSLYRPGWPLLSCCVPRILQRAAVGSKICYKTPEYCGAPFGLQIGCKTSSGWFKSRFVVQTAPPQRFSSLIILNGASIRMHDAPGAQRVDYGSRILRDTVARDLKWSQAGNLWFPLECEARASSRHGNPLADRQNFVEPFWRGWKMTF